IERQHGITDRTGQDFARCARLVFGLFFAARGQRQWQGDQASKTDSRVHAAGSEGQDLSSAARKSPARASNARSHACGSTEMPSLVRLVTPNSSMPQGTMPVKWDRSG